MEQHAPRQVVHVVSCRQQGGHEDVSGLHRDVRHGQPQQCPAVAARASVCFHEIAGYNQESGHVESVDKILEIGIAIAYINKVEGYHEEDKQGLEEIQFLDSFLGFSPWGR